MATLNVPPLTRDIYYMVRKLLLYLIPILILIAAVPAAASQVVDLYSDTWVATDALGRVMPTSDVTPLKNDKDRTVGIFYITWHDEDKYIDMEAPYAGDVTKTLLKDPAARLETYHPAWHGFSHHWGEPEDGYFLSRDKYVIRKDMAALTDAGVDVLILDCTNGCPYWDEWQTLFETMTEIKAQGNPVPKICFWCFNGDPVGNVTEIYDRYYKPGLFSDLWFYWDGKPLLCYNANPAVDATGSGFERGDYPAEIKEFFTLRNLWWGFYDWGGECYFNRDDCWCFGYELNDERVAALTPAQRASRHNGKIEEMAVTTAQHSITMTGKSWRIGTGEPQLNIYDLPDSAYVPWLGKTVDNPQGYGIYFQDRWDEALAVDPPFIYVNDWNEWTAGKFINPEIRLNGDSIYRSFMGRENPFFYVDQYNAEFNRTIQPMKGDYTDNYYYQLVQNIRRYKGVRPIATDVTLVANGRSLDDFACWESAGNVFYDTRGDVAHRDHNGYGGLHYTNRSGRNDIVQSRVAMDSDYVYFYVRCDTAITPSSDSNWMLLLIDSDCSSSTGWYGYDYIVNYEVRSDSVSTLKRYDTSSMSWRDVADVRYLVDGDRMVIAVPLDLIGLDSGISGQFDFKWSDNAESMDDPIEMCINGDTAPNRRFNYRYKWNFNTHPVNND